MLNQLDNKGDIVMQDNRLVTLIANGEITVAELAKATDLIERANLVVEAISACQKTLVFPFGSTKIHCYSYTDRAGEYSAWGDCTSDGIFRCFCNWGGNHKIGEVNLMSFKDVFLAFENSEFEHDLRRFLKEQIKKAKMS